MASVINNGVMLGSSVSEKVATTENFTKSKKSRKGTRTGETGADLEGKKREIQDLNLLRKVARENPY